MSEREYIVSLNRDVDYDRFNKEMIASTGAGDIPQRAVGVANARPGSQRNTHYNLTDNEAALLQNDSRVFAVELKPELRDDIYMEAMTTQSGNFTKTSLDTGDYINWGLRRMNSIVNPYIGNNVTGGYDHTLDGTGVDIVIQDSGIQVDHPEFYVAGTTTSRVKQIDWYTSSGLSGTQNALFYRDLDGHGTHVASTAAGILHGWAKGAEIYAIKVNGLEGSGDAGTGMPVSDCFDVIKEWHKSKPINPATGVKRPTIVNMSWGYFGYFSGITGGNYRGIGWSGTARRADYGMIGRFNGFGYTFGKRVASVDVDMEELIDAGVIVCTAAGNSYQRIDPTTGADYNNYFTTASGQVYYNRGGSPASDNAIVVGNIDSSIHSTGVEQKASSSESGPGVTVYAPGTNVMAGTSTINKWGSGSADYESNTSFKQTNISGTSMASPQVAGTAALFAQINPEVTPAEMKTYITSNAPSGKIYDTGLDDDYADSRSIKGSANKYGYNKFNSPSQMILGQVEGSTSLAPSYALSAPVSTNEGSAITITLTTSNVPDATQVGYTITGVNSADISGESLTGNFTVLLNSASLSLTIANDFLTEGPETLKLTLNDYAESVDVAINDTSVAVTQTYALASNVPTVSEGNDLTITLTTEYVDDGTNIPYLISGVSTADIGGESLSGNFTVQSNTASLILRISEDAVTEGLETLVLGLQNGEASVSVDIADTSQAGGQAYNLSTSTLEVNEGGNFTITLSTLNVADTSSIPYTITGVDTADINAVPMQGNFVVSGNTASQVFTVSSDLTTEGDETFILTLDGGLDSISVVIKDTSFTPTVTFTLSASSQNINEGDTVTVNLTTTNLADDETVPYTITGINSSDLSSGDLTGNFTITSNTASLAFTLADDLTTEGTETMTLTLPSGDAIAIQINDTSLAPTYTLTPSALSVNEGGTVTVTLSTTGVSSGTTIGYTVTGITEGDLSAGTMTGNFVTDTTDVISFTLDEDTNTEGDEFMVVSLTGGPSASTSITVNDTSQAPTFTPDYSITVTNAGNNYYFSGTDRNGTFNNSPQPTLAYNNADKVQFNVDAGTASAHPFYIKTAQVAGTGSQASGVVGQGTGTLQWTIDSSGTYWYQCRIHNGMHNTITVT